MPQAGIDNLPVTSAEGRRIAEVTIPPVDGDATLVVVETPDNLLPDKGEPVTAAINVVVLTSEGELTQFDADPVTLCFFNVDTTEDRCLAFINDAGEWECEDFCLSAGKDNSVCGDSDHLTNFAILLDTRGGSDSRCDSSSLDLSFVWASTALVVAAIILVLFTGLVYEVRLRMAVKADDVRLTRAFVESPVATNAAAAADAIAAADAVLPLDG